MAITYLQFSDMYIYRKLILVSEAEIDGNVLA
jgi:hypothetical protein